MMTYAIFDCRQKGFSLVELMIAMVIGLVIVLGAGQLFLNGFQSFRQVSELGEKQAALTFVSDILVREIRRGSFKSDRYELKDSEDGESCTLFDTVDKQPIVDGLADENGCDWELVTGNGNGVYRVRLWLEGEKQPFMLYAIDRTEAVKPEPVCSGPPWGNGGKPDECK